MMRLLPCLLGALALFAADAAEARFDDRDAKHACKRFGRQNHNAAGYHGLTVQRPNDRRYVVTGVLERQGRRDLAFRCVVRDREVAKFDTNRGGGSSASSDSGLSTGEALGAALAIGIGAAIIGAASDDHKHDDYRSSSDGHDHRKDWGRKYLLNDGRIVCYRGQRACYGTDDGNFAPRWTRREFGG
ncbi:MAG: hypothetical protein AAFP17_06170 [Pseudomonadota bacterium]